MEGNQQTDRNSFQRWYEWENMGDHILVNWIHHQIQFVSEDNGEKGVEVLMCTILGVVGGNICMEILQCSYFVKLINLKFFLFFYIHHKEALVYKGWNRIEYSLAHKCHWF